MKKVLYIAALVIFVSCAKSSSMGDAGEDVVFDGTFSDVDTRTHFIPYVSYSIIEWDRSDMVNVFVGGRSYQYEAEQSGAYSKLIPVGTSAPVETRYFALYPYDADALMKGDVVRTQLPSVQIAVENGLSAHLSVAETGSANLLFRNVCGLFRVRISEDNIEKVVFRGNDNETVAGGIDVAVSSEPTWTAADGVTSIVLEAPGGGTFSGGLLYGCTSSDVRFWSYCYSLQD